LVTSAVRILLTGSTGFVGSHILSNLVKFNHFSVDAISKSNQSLTTTMSNLRYLSVNYEQPEFLEILSKNKYDVLIHAGWRGLPEKSRALNQLNFDASQRLFESFVNSGGGCIVGLGSCLEYGVWQGNASETDCGREIGQFGLIKKRIANVVSNFNVPYLWLRPFYLYGANQHANSLLSLTIANLNNQNHFWMKEPLKANDFVYVDDLGRLISNLIDRNFWLGELNVGTSSLTTNIEFVNQVRRELGRKEYVFTKRIPEGLSADLTKLHEWLPEFEFNLSNQGLKKYLNEIKSRF